VVAGAFDGCVVIRSVARFDAEGSSADAGAGAAGAFVDLTMMSSASEQSNNSNAANHHIIGAPGARCSAMRPFSPVATFLFPICGVLYDRMMNGARCVGTAADAGAFRSL